MTRCPASRTWRHALLAAALAAAGTARAAGQDPAPVPLAPVLPGQYAAGAGVDATFLKVYDTWRDSAVRYDPVSDTLGVGQPIGGFPGGSGLWGLVDWQTAHGAPPPGMIETQWSGRVAQIAFGDAMYEQLAAPGWGSVALAPLFGPGSAASSQDNWTSHFAGYLRIAAPGAYNFGVLHDDGFFFTLTGALGQSQGIHHDFLNPRSRMSFANALQLDAGLYRFELGAYERLEVGVVELSWSVNGGDFERVPGAHLVAAGDVTPVPEPATTLLLLAGLALTASWARRRPR